MATATMKNGRTKKTGPELTDVQREAAIRRFLYEPNWFDETAEQIISGKGNRVEALEWIHSIHFDRPSENGEPAIHAGVTGLDLTFGGVALPLIPWDEIIDAAIDADAGAETWAVPTAESEKRNPSSESMDLLAKVYRDPEAKPTNGDRKIAGPDGWEPADGERQPNGKPAAHGPKSPKDTGSSSLATRRSPLDAAAGMIPVDAIEPNPFQPRKEFDAEELQKLADTIRLYGLIQPIAVRPKPGSPDRYQLIAGERRLRATKLAGLQEIRVACRAASDADLKMLGLIENLRRVDLNPIERAESFQEILAGPGMTQQRLAEQLGMSQPAIANTVRLLELPEPWRQRVICEISASHAGALARYAAHPKILKKVDQFCHPHGEKSPNFGSLADFVDTIRTALHHEGFRLGKETWSVSLGRRVSCFEPTDAELKKLDVVTIDGHDDKPERFALNTKLAGQLQAKHVAALSRAQKKKGTGTKKSSGAVAAANKTRPRELSDLLPQLIVDWQLMLIARDLATRGADDPVFLRLTIGALCCGDLYEGTYDVRFDELMGLPRSAARRMGSLPDPDFIDAIFGKRCCDLDSLMQGTWLKIFSFDPKKGPSLKCLPPETAAAIAGGLQIDRAAAWREELLGPLTAGYFEMHSLEQLVALAAELGIGLAGYEKQGKAAVIRQLMLAPGTKKKLPAELAGPKNSRKGAKAQRGKKSG